MNDVDVHTAVLESDQFSKSEYWKQPRKMFLASGTFNFVLTVCPPSPNVDKRGSEWHLFLQRPDHRLHFTNHVCCQAIGLRITSRPLFCRNIDVMRLLSRKLGFSRQDPVRSHHQLAGFLPNFSARECFYGPGCVTPFHGTPAAWTHLCAVPHGRCGSQHMPMYHVRGRFPGVGPASHLLPRTHGRKRETVRQG